jgi:predicted phage terminase large subunit-like protein
VTFQKKPPRRQRTEDESAGIAALRMLAAKKSRESLLTFTGFTMPHPEAIDDPRMSRYKGAKHHQIIAEHLEAVERGEILRLIITMPPRAGKSELASRRFPAWFQGRDPYRQFIFATYNATFAQDFGREVRDIMLTPEYGLTFPGTKLKRDSQASDRLQTTEGGLMVFVGAEGSVTGRGADLLLMDDPIKSRDEAESATIRDKVWNFFTSAAYTRLMPGGRIVIILTRWHEDDVVGRIFNSDYVDPEESAKWKVLTLPAIAGQHDPMGRAPGEALWPERYPLETLNSIRKVIGSRDWSALYQQQPTPDDGSYFLRSMFKPYQPGELPRNLRKYGASDHAVGEKQQNDASVLGCVGIDENDDIWIMPDIDWGRFAPDVAVDLMLEQFRRHDPVFWWAEKGHISQSLGPFLRKRMRETQTYQSIEEMTPSVDKLRRARSIMARAAVRQIRVPAFAPWWPDALSQLLKFPNDAHDDFVDWLAWIGIGLDRLAKAAPPRKVVNDNPYKVGSAPWVITQSRREAQILNFSRKRAVGM